MPFIASFLAAIIPMLLYMFFIWKMDMYEREPLKFVLIHFLWGAIGAIAISIFFSTMLVGLLGLFFVNSKLSLIQTVLIAPFVEETIKASFLIFTLFNREFDNITDGLVYGAAIGLGFGMTENVMYFITYGTTIEAWITIVFVRSGFSAVMHGIATATVGAFLGLYKFSSSAKRNFLPFAGLLIAMFIHFMWNYSVSFGSTFLLGFFFIILIIICFIIIFKMSLNKEREILLSELQGEIPDEYVKIIASKFRYKSGWIDESIKRNFVNFATKLAFRKRQIQQTNNVKLLSYKEDIVLLRKKLGSIMELSSNRISGNK